MSKYRVFSGPYFPVFSLNTGKCRPGKTPYLDSFHAVQATVLYIWRRALGIEKCSSTISENKRKNPEFQTSWGNANNPNKQKNNDDDVDSNKLLNNL